MTRPRYELKTPQGVTIRTADTRGELEAAIATVHASNEREGRPLWPATIRDNDKADG